MAQPFIISIKAFLDGKGVKSGAQESKAAVSDLSKSATGEINKMSSMAGMFNRQIAAIGFTLLASFGPYAMTRTLAGFEGSMAGVQAVTRATGAEVDALRGKAMDLGATTEFSASQAASGLKFLGQAGFNANQAISALPATLDLATIAQMDLGTSADITSNIMSGFRIEAEKTNRVVDILAGTSTRSNTNVVQLGDAMRYVAPLAKGMSIEIEETAAAIGVMSDAGLQGSMAGTGLQMIIASLIDPTNQAQKALARFGLTTADVSPATHSLTQIMETMIAAGVDATNIFSIMEARAARSWITLAGGIPKLKSLTQTLKGLDGEGAQLAKTMRDNLQGDLQGLGSAAEAVTLSLGDAGITGTLRTVAQTGTAALRALADNADLLRAGLMTLVAGGIVLVARGFNAAAISAASYVGAQLGAIQSARAAAVAEHATAAARLRSAEMAMAVARANGLVTGSYAVLSRELLAARMGMAAANATMAQTAIGARAATLATRGLSAAYALIGGPFGVALLAGYAVYEFWQTQQRATEVSELHKKALDENRQAIDLAKGATVEYRAALADQISMQIKAAEATLAEAQARLESARLSTQIMNSQSLYADSSSSGLIDAATERFDKVSEVLAGLKNQFREMMDPLSWQALQDFLYGTGDSNTPPNTGGTTDTGTDKVAEAYKKIITSIDRKTAALRLEASTLGMTAEATRRLTMTQELLNQALDAGKKLTPDVVTELSKLATGYAAIEAQVKKLKDVYDTGRSATQSFFSDLKSELMNGTSLWNSFGSAASNVLNKIADKALGMASNGIWDLIWGGAKSILGGFGGIGPINLLGSAKGNVFAGGNMLDAYANQIVSKPTLFTFANGGTLGLMGEAGEEAIMPLTRGSDGTLGVRAYANQNSSSSQATNYFTYAPVFNFPQGTSREDMKSITDHDRREFERMTASAQSENKRRGRAA